MKKRISGIGRGRDYHDFEGVATIPFKAMARIQDGKIKLKPSETQEMTWLIHFLSEASTGHVKFDGAGDMYSFDSDYRITDALDKKEKELELVAHQPDFFDVKQITINIEIGITVTRKFEFKNLSSEEITLDVAQMVSETIDYFYRLISKEEWRWREPYYHNNPIFQEFTIRLDNEEITNGFINRRNRYLVDKNRIEPFENSFRDWIGSLRGIDKLNEWRSHKEAACDLFNTFTIGGDPSGWMTRLIDLNCYWEYNKDTVILFTEFYEWLAKKGYSVINFK